MKKTTLLFSFLFLAGTCGSAMAKVEKLDKKIHPKHPPQKVQGKLKPNTGTPDKTNQKPLTAAQKLQQDKILADTQNVDALKKMGEQDAHEKGFVGQEDRDGVKLLDRQAQDIQQQAKADMAGNGGRLSKTDEKELEAQETQLHDKIDPSAVHRVQGALKPDTGTPDKTSQKPLTAAQKLQQDKILADAENVDALKKMGKQAAHEKGFVGQEDRDGVKLLDRQAQDIQQQAKADMAGNGGRLTETDEKELEAQETQLHDKIDPSAVHLHQGELKPQTDTTADKSDTSTAGAAN